MRTKLRKNVSSNLAPRRFKKKDVIIARFNGDMHPDVVAVNVDVLDCIAANGYQPFLISLPGYPYKTNVEKKAAEPEVNGFAYTKSAAIQQFENGFVTPALRFAQVYFFMIASISSKLNTSDRFFLC